MLRRTKQEYWAEIAIFGIFLVTVIQRGQFISKDENTWFRHDYQWFLHSFIHSPIQPFIHQFIHSFLPSFYDLEKKFNWWIKQRNLVIWRSFEFYSLAWWRFDFYSRAFGMGISPCVQIILPPDFRLLTGIKHSTIADRPRLRFKDALRIHWDSSWSKPDNTGIDIQALFENELSRWFWKWDIKVILEMRHRGNSGNETTR